ncbi:MAG TPA: glycosyltransferase family 2 protein [Terriglobales bacterium]
MKSSQPRIAVIVPSYKVRAHIAKVIQRIGPEVERIYAVDDKCPEGSGDFIEQTCKDPRVVVIRNAENQGVGGTVMAGYRAAIADGMEILVKVDGDGQMDAALIPQLVAPIVQGVADYTKGNRFYSPEALDGMPTGRLLGNAGLSFFTKLSSGYWDVLDPTNGFTAIHALVADVLPLQKVAKRYFFESDLLFRLNTVRAVVVDIPMFSVYGTERSNFRAGAMIFPFFWKNLVNFWKRVLYAYFLRGFSFASFCLLFGMALFLYGMAFGSIAWIASAGSGEPTPVGTVMLAVVPLILGFQLLMGFFAADIASVPSRALHQALSIRPAKPLQPFSDVEQARSGGGSSRSSSVRVR